MNKKSLEKPIMTNNAEIVLNEDGIINLLEEINIGTFRSINIQKEMMHSPYNKSVVIRIPDQSCSSDTDILLNFKQGQSTVDQVFNAIYREGSDWQKRIIVFTSGDASDDKFNPSADIGTAKCLFDNMNRFDLNLYLVQLITDSTSSIPEYEFLATPPDQTEFSRSQCPSIEKFTEAEFWNVYFWGYNNWTEATPYEYGFDSDSQFDLCYPVGDMAITLEWTGEGALIRIEDSNDNNKHELHAIWAAYDSDILAMFKGCDIQILIRAGAVMKLKVTVFDKRIGDLAGTPWREKRHYAGLMWSKFTQCYEFMEKALQDARKKWRNENAKT